MADQGMVNGRLAGDLLEAHLHDTLPDTYAAVYEPTVRDQRLDAVVVGPQGLFVLHGVAWQGQITPSPRGPWRERLASGQVVRHPNSARIARRATQALRAFLRDEFPDLQTDIHQFVVLLHPAATLDLYGTPNPPCIRLDALGPEILGLPTEQHPLTDQALREALATALNERRLTRTQRAAQPFIFRSGGWLGRGEKAHTIQQVLRHMDRHPADGVHHLRNGSLERWFHEQGALHLATLAQGIMQKNVWNPYVCLESFMLGTGLVRRPRLIVKPRRVNMGYVLEGEKATGALRLRQGRGRGYLYGTVEPGHSWMQVDPSDLAGSLNAVVTVDTSSLLITEQPARSYLTVRSNATEQPVQVPVAIHVMPALSRLSRHVLRPAFALSLAGLIGGAIGWALAPLTFPAPAWLTHLTQPPLPSQVVWAVLCAAFWAIIGTVRSYAWDAAWPLAYSLRRWLLRVALWGFTLGGLAFVVPWLIDTLLPEFRLDAPAEAYGSLILLATTSSILPGTWGDMRDAQAWKDPSRPGAAMHGLRRSLVGVLGVIALLVTVRLAIPLWERGEGQARVATVQTWVDARWTQLGAGIADLWDKMYLRYYDRRAPSRSTPTPVATALPVHEEQAP
jgi:hypothetical protein